MPQAERLIKPERDLHRLLLGVEVPSRYVGGEFGAVVKHDRSLYRVGLSFPDLYEIGMSNTAIKLLYGMLNRLEGVACERVFAPAPDFEEALRVAEIPLYTLETGTPLHQLPLIALSVGYELLATNVLTLLNSGGVPLRRLDRGEADAIVIAGGPGITNPLPLSQFIDAVFVGEAESALPSVVQTMAEAQRNGASRMDCIRILDDHPSFWTPRSGRVRRAVWSGFGNEAVSVRADSAIPPAYGAGFPVPSMPVVQDHGVVEIMRGCPQGCRFCHAGVYYRPFRMRSIDTIVEHVDWLVHTLGYREISLSSLSSGDYGDLVALMRTLQSRYAQHGISFQLPSLRVSSLTLPLFEELSRGKRTGLTFAVEAGDTTLQASMNKMVPVTQTIALAREAIHRGWSHAKLYFMVGLPFTTVDAEIEAIAAYVRELRRGAKMEYVVNVGIFVPKPHTPFQWHAQVDADEAQQALSRLRELLPRGTKLRGARGDQSWLEGILSRGDERVGDVVLDAWRRGARMDAWGELYSHERWQTAATNVTGATIGLGPFSLEEPLPWDDVHVGVSRHHLRREYERARAGELTEHCAPECADQCGVCNRTVNVRTLNEKPSTYKPAAAPSTTVAHSKDQNGGGRTHQLVVVFSRRGRVAYLSHLALVRTFERIWHRLAVPLVLTEGYHPKPKMSFSQPLPLGVESDAELIIVNVQKSIQIENVYHNFLSVVPAGIGIVGAGLLYHEPGAPRIPTPMQAYGGSEYVIRPITPGWDETAREFAAAALTPHGIALDCGDRDARYAGDAEGGRVTEDQVARFVLTKDQPGLGRLLKNGNVRDVVRIRRTRQFVSESIGESMMDSVNEKARASVVSIGDFYRMRDECTAWHGASE